MHARSPAKILLAACLLLGSIFSSVHAAVEPERVRQSMARIFALNAKGELVSSGSGFVVTQQGHVLTNRHVVKDAARIQIALAGNEKDLWEAKLLEQSAALDFALLQAAGMKPSRPVTLNSLRPRQSQRVYALGFPGASDNLMARLSMEPTYTEGIISKLERANSAAGTRLLIQHTADLALGNSGGPLLNTCNEVIGTNTLIAKAYEQGPVAPGFYGAVAISEVVERLAPLNMPLALATSACGTASDTEPTFTATAPAANEPPISAPPPETSTQPRLVIGLGVLLVGLMALLIALGSWLARKRRTVAEGSPAQKPLVEKQLGIEDGRPLFQADAPTRQIGNRPVAQLEIIRSNQNKMLIDLDGTDFANGRDGVILGRDPEICHVQIPDDSVSRRQLRLTQNSEGFWVEDLNSSNGTDLNGRRLAPFEPHPVRHGDRLRIGDVQLSFLSRPQ